MSGYDYKMPALAAMGRVDFQGNEGVTFDAIIVTGDAYVDHHAFGAAVVVRCLENLGLRVAVIAQPRWNDIADFTVFGRPKLFFGVTAGAMDSMVANFTSLKMPRKTDRLSPGGRTGLRPKRAVQVYVQRLREAFPDVPIVVGGIEASLRRFAHYDFWEDRIRDPILIDAPADLLVYGMAEGVLPDVVDWLRSASGSRKSLQPAILPQCCIRVKPGCWSNLVRDKVQILPSTDEIRCEPSLLLKLAKILDVSVRPNASVYVQPHPKGDIVCFPPDPETVYKEIAAFDRLHFTRRAHPLYDEPIPALQPVQFSVVSHRGCIGACTFCSIALHQGRQIRSRSIDAILSEISQFPFHPDFRGTVPDLSGPSINMYGWDNPSFYDHSNFLPNDAKAHSACSPSVGHHQHNQNSILTSLEKSYNQLELDKMPGLRPLAELLSQIRSLPGIRHVFLGSGLRYDLIRPSDLAYLFDILRHHISGQLKVAPEHIDFDVLRLMRKGAKADFLAFVNWFREACRKLNRELYLVPYFMTAFPGAGDKDLLIAQFVRRHRLAHKQIQEFTPTPGTIATAMYWTGLDFNGNPIDVARTNSERRNGRKLIQTKTTHRTS